MPNLLERVEELHRRVTELEQRVPKPIPVVEPLADGITDDAPAIQRILNQQANMPRPAYIEAIERGMVPPPDPQEEVRRLRDQVSGIPLMRHQIENGQKVFEEWKERAERAEAELKELRDAVATADWWIERWRTDEDHADDADWYVRKVDASLARARVAKAVP